MIVTRAALEAGLSELAAGVSDPAAGIHGPGSASWQLERDAAIFLGGGRAALLQLAHPFVAYGVAEHSRTRTDVVGRFQRTFDNVFAMAFGTLEDAVVSARRVHNIHTRVTGVIGEDAGAFARGTPYAGNDAAALRWVWATLVDSVDTVYTTLGSPLTSALRDDYYRGARRFAALFGIPPAMLPADWAAFARYVADTAASSTITVTTPARELAGFLFGGRLGPIARLISTALLPAAVRRQYGLRFGAIDRAQFAAVIGAVRAARVVTPRAAWELPAYQNAARRLRGLPPSWWSTFVDGRLQALAGRTAARSG